MAIAEITKSSIERLFKNISVEILPHFYKDKPIRLNSLVYEEIRMIILNFLKKVI
jgi:histone H3/H4